MFLPNQDRAVREIRAVAPRGVRLRRARRADAEAIHAIHTRAVRWYWPACYSDRQIAAWLAGRTAEGYHEGIDGRGVFVAEQRGLVVGFGHARPGRVEAVFVDPHAAPLGAGSALLRRAVAMASRRHRGAVGLAATLNAVPFYRAHGFRCVGRSVVVKTGVTLRVVRMELPR